MHNTAELGCGRVLERLPEIIERLGALAERFCTMLDCASVGFISDRLLDQLPQTGRLGSISVGGVRVDSPRMRVALASVTALSPAPKGFTVAELASRVRAMTGQREADHTTRQAAYDLGKLRAKGLVAKPGRSRRYHLPPEAVRTITALTTLRDHVLAPILAGIRSARPVPVDDRRAWSAVEHRYETLRLEIEALFNDLRITAAA